jgi:hypothetical protein
MFPRPTWSVGLVYVSARLSLSQSLGIVLSHTRHGIIPHCEFYNIFLYGHRAAPCTGCGPQTGLQNRRVTESTALCNTSLCYTVLCYTALCYTTLCYTALCYTALCYTALCYTTLCYTALCYTALCYTALCYTALFYTALCYTALCYTASKQC